MKTSYKIILFLSIFLAACSGKNKIKVINTDFENEISQFQNLTFEFNNDLASDSMLNMWDSTEYITIEPKVEGKFKWLSKNKISFSPNNGFKPSTNYKAKLTKRLNDNSLKKRRVSKETFKFHTPYLKLAGMTAYWALADESASKIEIRVNLSFNYIIDAKQLQNILKVKVKNVLSKFKILTVQNSDVIVLSLESPKSNLSESIPVEVTIDKGLVCMGSSYQTEDILSSVFEIPPQDQLQISQVLSSFEKGKGIINIFTSQPLGSQDLKSLINITPVVNFKAELLPNGMMLSGEFIEGETYQLSISKNLKSVFGILLNQDYLQSITFGKLEPYISFAEQNSIYLSSKGEKNIAINIINVPEIKVTVFKVFENNLIHYLRDGQQWGYYYDDEEYYDYQSYPMNVDYGKEIFSKNYTTRSMPKFGNLTLFKINLTDFEYNSNFKGLYIIKIESTDKRWLQESKLVSVSDIGLIVKEGVNDYLVFTNSIKDAKPLSGVKINFISSNNQVIYSTSTGSDGIAIIEDAIKKMKDFKISMITARSGEDFNFLLFNKTRIETSRSDVGGKRTKGIDYDVFIYSERNIYRPGDSVKINTVVRKLNWETDAKIPVKVRVVMPNGKDFINLRKQIDSEGSAETKFNLSPDIMTGTYTIEVYSGNDVLLNSYNISVEEFMPDRIKVLAKLDKIDYSPANDIKLSLNAMNLFGPPAANRNYEVEMELKKKSFNPENFPGYNFDVNSKVQMTFDKIVRQGKTNNEGNVTEVFRLPSYVNTGIIQGNIYSTVFDETGRPVNRIVKFNLYTQNIFLGIKNSEYWVGTKQPVKFGMVASNKDGKTLNNIKAQIQIFRIFYETVMEKDGSRYIYKSQRREQLITKKFVIISSNNSIFSFIPMISGQYEVQISMPNTESFVKTELYAYGWGDTEYSSFEVQKDGEITIEADKAKYQIGEKANLLFKAPFDGNIIVTIERDNIIKHYYLTTEKKAASLSLKIEEKHLPNIYVTATAIREMKDNSIPLTVAHGIASIIVEKPSNKMDVKIYCTEKSKSNTKQTIKVIAAPNSELTIAAVDEGILQLTNFQTPDIYQFFYTKRALEVNSYDIYAYLYPEIKGSFSSIAGDGGFDLSKRVNPLTNKRVKLVALWSGILKTNSRGECAYTINIPSFSGSLRIMAVVYKGKQFGSAEKSMKVADPVVISTALPRFLSPKDNADIPVTLTNTTTNTIKTSVSIKVKGPVLPDGSISQSITLKANSETTVHFNIIAQDQIGNAEINIMVQNGKDIYKDMTDITVRPAAGLLKISDGGSVKGGGVKTLNLTSDYIPSSITSKLVISRSPIAEFSKDLGYLLNYPYGCVEQTISTAFPLLYFKDLCKTLKQSTYNQYNPDWLVQEAIRKVESMQQYNGGISYWLGSDDISWWGSAYAAHFLYEAQKAGYNVSQNKLDNIIKYLEQRTRKRETYDYIFYDGTGKRLSKTIAAKETFYSLFVLALTGKQNISVMNYYKSNLNEIALDSKYLLAATFALAGDNISYHYILPKGFDNERSVREFGRSFYSYIRDLGISLYTLLEVDPNNNQIGTLVKHLSVTMKKEHWMSTQERAFGLLALGKFARYTANSTAIATVTVDNKIIGQFKDKDLVITQNIQNKNIKVSASGNGSVYYFYEMEGISSTGNYKQEDNFIIVRKNFYDRFGNLLSGNTFSQNDLVVIEIQVKTTDGSTVDNVAVTDILPACFEIENPRISPERDLPWIKNKAEPDYLDIRDDRVSFFTKINGNQKSFYYMVRVVTTGKYKMGPVTADAMYNGEYHSVWGGRDVFVK